MATVLKCEKCGAAMEEAINIAPFGTGPGLKVFECPDCGTRTTRLEQRRRPNPSSRSSADK
jgi:predicted RNA-binding Zn-ribbon protein involved in translation (DUF1610 family)